jgi:TonB family protein
MLAHEDEHVRARDPWLLAGGTAALVLAPWNPALWWLLQRLRLAVEMDCDARVLARGHGVPDYGELLLQVGQHRAHRPLMAAALGEPRSFLERRILRLAARLPRWRWLGAGAAAAVGTVAIIAACEAPLPVAPDQGAPMDSVATRAAMSEMLLRADSARAVALVRRNLCGEPRDPGDAACPVALLSAPRLEYPELLRRAGIEKGRVVVQAIIDSTGHVEPSSVKVLESSHPGFDQAAKNFVLGAVFAPGRPGRVDGRAVRALINVPVEFRWVDRGFMPSVQYLQAAARRLYPDMFARPAQPGAAIALVFDAHGRVIAHAAGVREVSDDRCLAVVDRLVPEFRASKSSSSGCADTGHGADRVINGVVAMAGSMAGSGDGVVVGADPREIREIRRHAIVGGIGPRPRDGREHRVAEARRRAVVVYWKALRGS